MLNWNIYAWLIAGHFSKFVFHSERLQIGFYAGDVEEEQCETSSGGLPPTVCLYGCSGQCGTWIPYASIEAFCGPGSGHSEKECGSLVYRRGSDFM